MVMKAEKDEDHMAEKGRGEDNRVYDKMTRRKQKRNKLRAFVCVCVCVFSRIWRQSSFELFFSLLLHA